MDVAHMLKLMRNNFANLIEIKTADGSIVSWIYLEKLFKLQETETLNIANKLKKKHMEWQRHKMKVNLAAQTLSSRVADALAFLKEDLQLPDFRGAEATILFIQRIDKLFDLLNSRSPWATGFKGPLKALTEYFWRPFLLETGDVLFSYTNKEGRPLWCTAKKTPFIGRLLLHTQISGKADTTTILTIPSTCEKKNKSTIMDISVLRKYNLESLTSPEDHDYDVLPQRVVDLSEISENVVAYIGGYVTNMLKKRIKCYSCILKCIVTCNEGSKYKLIINRKNRGRLTVPSEGVVCICLVTESYIRKIMMLMDNKIPKEDTCFLHLLSENIKYGSFFK